MLQLHAEAELGLGLGTIRPDRKQPSGVERDLDR
jgi:hypothetical protein